MVMTWRAQAEGVEDDWERNTIGGRTVGVGR
jgi:hypothetical protein